MVNFINKAVWAILNPVSIGLVLLVLGLALHRFRRAQTCCLAGALLWLYLLSTQLFCFLIGYPLEKDYLVNGRMPDAESYPVADAILDFGGGVGACTNISKYAELYPAADRAYFAAALWKARKAPIIIPSTRNAALGDAKFLQDLGIPSSAIIIENAALNTEENAKKIAETLKPSNSQTLKLSNPQTLKPSNPPPLKLLLVTSAWHMKRSLLMMEKYAPSFEVIPAPCDFGAAISAQNGFALSWLLPNADALLNNSIYLHEWLGYLAYKLIR